MEINLFSQNELPLVFKVLRSALNPAELNNQEKSFLSTYAKITGFEESLENIKTINVADVQMSDAHKSKRLVQLAAMAVMLSNPMRLISVNYVEQLDKHLNTQEPVIPVLYAAMKKQKFKVRILTMRRMMKVIIGESYRKEGIMGVIRFLVAIIARVRVNKDKLWKYKRLGLLPEGTLGREYWKHITEEGFGFPGEPGGIPDAVSYHDVSHVLNGHNTTPLGEIQQGSFQGGCRREGGFGFVQFVILQFHHGFKITPVAEGEVGNFDPVKVLWAIHRGEVFKYDVTEAWDYWPLMSLPIDQARKQCNLIPLL